MSQRAIPTYPWWRTVLLSSLVFAVALLPRVPDLDRFVTIDEPTWMRRSYDFWAGLARGDLGATFQKNAEGNTHPGVTTMWLAGGGMYLQAHLSAGDSPPPEKFDRTQARSYLWAAKLPIVLVTAFATLGMFFLLRRLLDQGTAFLGALLVALDPFYIGHARLVHVDALLATFMALSLLALLVYLKAGGKGLLLLSGATAGLAFLTKAPSGFLVPFALGLLLWQRRSSGFPRGVREFVTWGVSAGGVFVLLWPALWVDPLHSVLSIFRAGTNAATLSHFAGLGYVLEPLFYLSSLVYDTTPFTLILPLLFLLTLIVFPQTVPPPWKQTTYSILAFILLFLLAMTLAAKKGDRYLLPVYPFLDVLAAMGVLVWMPYLRKLRGPVPIKALLPALVLLLGTYYTFTLHPYYQARANPLIPLSHQTEKGLGEGLELAATYLQQQHASAPPVVATWYSSIFGLFYPGRALELRDRHRPEVEYVVLYRGMFGRPVDSEASRVLGEYLGKQEPEHTITLNGLPYVWIFKTHRNRAS